MKFRKKPIIVEAEQFFPDKPLPHRDKGAVVCFDGAEWFVITIHNREARLDPGDWVILEPGDGLKAYPCKPDVFKATYEPVD